MDRHNTYAIIDLDAISANFRALREKAGVPVMAVLKADAYGHGAVPVGRLLQDQCAFFGVSSLQEAQELRRAGLDKPILILGRVPVSAFPSLLPEGIRPTISCYEDALALSETAQELQLPAPFHFAVDTGMSRIGFQVTEEDADLCRVIAQLPGLVAEGLFSHLATADCQDLTQTHRQVRLFDRFDAMLRSRGVSVDIRHLDNSAGILQLETHYDMVRAGISIYGLLPSDQVDTQTVPLQRALSWYSRVTHLKWLPAGRTIGYGATHTLARTTQIATISVGYADGYRRSLSDNFYVLIRGRKAPVLGRICMDQLMVDVTGIADVAPDDPVVLLGTDGDLTITPEQIAQAAGSFHYEFICGISRRVPRLYQHQGKLIHEVDYLIH